ncbi:helix-turn-helix domain-containing protein [Catenulispora rubra]|uniref:helix-turn-helix domain-containing protein n=1 Tax=Catenulispora rubra TaxID=280293 RepID=UPI0018922585|nr:AraC family transcriptional regulator [Catenulispora rubra]
MEQLIRQAVDLMRARYFDPLTLDDMADAAIMSKFHFIRMFRVVVGVTPCRYLSALRIQHAKRLLRSTTMNVSEISAEVGYSSTGSFTRRFTASVGCSPIQYRNHALVEQRRVVPAHPGGGAVTGTLHAPDQAAPALYVGVFESPILECPPVAHAVLERPGAFRLDRVPAGAWYLHAIGSVAPGGDGARRARRLLVDSRGPVEVASGGKVEVDLTVEPHRWTDPPMLFALPQLEAAEDVLARAA